MVSEEPNSPDPPQSTSQIITSGNVSPDRVPASQNNEMDEEIERNADDVRISKEEFPTYIWPKIKQQQEITISYSGMKMPLEIEELRKENPFPLPSAASEEFTSELLSIMFGGKLEGDGIYIVGRKSKRGHKLDSYLLLDSAYNPLVPTIPGQYSC